MALTDPQSITIDGETTSLPRTNVGDNKSYYKNGTEGIELIASSQYGKRIRRTVRVNTTKLSPNPFLPDQNVQVSGSIYLVFDFPVDGFTEDEQLNTYVGLHTLLSASSYANLVKVLNGES